MRISDWSSDVCSSDLRVAAGEFPPLRHGARPGAPSPDRRMERSHIVATEPGALDREGGPHDGEAVGIVRAGVPTGEASGIFRPGGTRAGRGRRNSPKERKNVVSGKSVTTVIESGESRTIKKKKTK